ncbi:MAG: hypothetical protein K8R56_04170 [Candidatus Eisenbacteria bacterium]|nr:hypothetical protein [Candidatus Eisenbacteria bacterium]
MRKVTTLLASGLMMAFAGAALAVTIDGSLDFTYGPAVHVQTTQTQFGDANINLQDYANGSELDGLHARVESGVLYLLITGNLESNFNKLELFFDTQAGGQNVLRSDNPDVDFNGLNRLAGLKFDTAFSPDYYITFGGGYDGSGYRLFANYAELLTGGAGAGYFLGSNTAVTPGPLNGGANPNLIQITINNSNSLGVSPGCDASSGDGVQTGMELAIPLTALGSPSGGCIKIFAGVNGGGHDFFSNQIIGSLPPGTCNLGNPTFVDFSAISGDQYVTVCNGATPAKKSSWGAVKSLYR